MSTKKLSEVNVIMYKVGFGDCFLLKFKYSDQKEVKLLIDCGTTTENKEYMGKIVDKILQDCNNQIDALIITHRHKDHLSAFNDKTLGGKLESLKPKKVLQPWTEDPKAASDAIETPGVSGTEAVEHINTLNDLQKIAQIIVKKPDRILSFAGSNISKQVKGLAEVNVPNTAAVSRLEKICKEKDHEYVFSGYKTSLKSILPGLKVMVLGPPTIKQSPAVKNQKKWDKDEFWKLYRLLASSSTKNLAAAKGYSILFPKAKTVPASKLQSYNKWFVKKLERIQLQNIRQLVRIMDDALNNTSIVLLFKFGDKALLFPGDAQLENWSYALNNKKIKDELKNVTLYKVGHHGSTNATPKTMWNIISKKHPLTTLLSTKSGKHSGVPQKTLVDTLDKKSTLVNTQKFGKKLSQEITFKVSA